LWFDGVAAMGSVRPVALTITQLDDDRFQKILAACGFHCALIDASRNNVASKFFADYKREQLVTVSS
jgi:hypothetical protein